MIKEIITKDGSLNSQVLDELYQEALDLSGSVVNFFQSNKKEDFQHLGVDVMGYYTQECNRITSGIMQAMSWCLMQKGVNSGEVTIEEASEQKHRLNNAALFATPIGCDTGLFPKEFISYSDRARDLFAKIVRCDRILFEGDSGESNPVHDMIDKLGEL